MNWKKSPSHDWVYIFQMEFNGVDLVKNSGIGEHMHGIITGRTKEYMPPKCPGTTSRKSTNSPL